MSESFEKWAADKDFLFTVKAGEGYINVRHMAREAWQAAKAQAGDGQAAGTVVEHNRLLIGMPLDAWEPAWAVGDKLYTRPQPAVNQQLLGDIINMMIAAKGAIKLGRGADAYNYIDAAIAAAQENKK